MEIGILENGVIVRTEKIAVSGFVHSDPYVTLQPGWVVGGSVAAGAYTPPVPAPATAEMVDAERDRRTEFGFRFARVAYQLDEKSISRITAMGADARFAVMGGAVAGDLRWVDPTKDFGWIATDNSVTSMDAQTMAAFAHAAKLWVSQHTFAGLALKKTASIPQDFAAWNYWPTSS